MKKTRLHLVWALSALGALACNSTKDAKKDNMEDGKTMEEMPVDPAHSSKNALDWNGTYQGTLPCADCDGIQTSVTLFESGKYNRTLTYLGKSDRGFTDNGDFTWNDAGSIVTLKAKDGQEQMYQVGENTLFHLDNAGKRIDGSLEEKYILKKNHMDPTLENKEWELVELMGEKVSFKEGQKKANITFHSELSRATGNNSCNVFTGSYELKPMGRIKLGGPAATLMACPDMEIADKFNQILTQVDNYAINEGMLSLNKARMAPLARFKLTSKEE
ncbi:MAG: copper resistance protein NlpE N-terminal domain-containing protein [Bacteroidota bacterium]